MVFFAAAVALLITILFWGLGLSWLCTPRRWKMAWPLFAGVAGLALQSAVVWVGVQMDWVGTQAYGRGSLIVPVVLLLVAWRRRGTADWQAWRRLAGVGAIMLVTLNCLIMPYASASKWLTSSSLGSCDAADYAAGARVLQDFAKSDRSGFIGLTEVVKVQSVDNFFDYWLYLNHFTPSAVIALNGALAGLQPYQLVSLTGAVLLVLGIPLAFWMARSGLRLSPLGALLVAAVYAFSPLLWYAVAHVSLSQLIAAPAIVMLTWCGVVLWRGGATLRRGLEVSGLLMLAYWLILGGYNFIVVVCLVPVLAYVAGHALWTGRLRRLAAWFAAMVLPLGVVALLVPARVIGLVDRFRLFQQYDFGWKIPALSPEGWYGLVGSVLLSGYGDVWRWTLSVLLVLGLVVALALAARRRQSTVYLAVCLTLPILVGYVFLLLKGRAQGTNASYDAYKLFSVFYPGMLGAFAYGLVHLRSRRRVVRALVGTVAVLVLAGNGLAAYRFAARLENPPLMVDRSLPKVQAIESMPEVKSVNLRIVDFWSRLWANSFLLRKPHYFPSHTYEGRLNTELKGEWDLLGGVVSVTLPDPRSHVQLERNFTLVDTRSPYFVRARVGEGWYDGERLPRANLRWRWTKGDAELIIENPQTRELNVGFRFQARSMEPRKLEIWVQGKRRRTFQLGTELSWVRVPSLSLPPGTTTVEIRSPSPPLPASPQDRRLLGFAAYGIEVNVRADPDPSDN